MWYDAGIDVKSLEFAEKKVKAKLGDRARLPVG